VNGTAANQADRADEHGDYFSGYGFGVDCGSEAKLSDAENEQHRQRRAAPA
jgi:hypothetical protein